MEGVENDCKRQRTRDFAMSLCLLEMLKSYTHKISPAWLPKYELTKDNQNRHAKMNGGRLQNLNNTQRMTSN